MSSLLMVYIDLLNNKDFAKIKISKLGHNTQHNASCMFASRIAVYRVDAFTINLTNLVIQIRVFIITRTTLHFVAVLKQ